MRAVQDQIAKWVPGDCHALGADGFGFADTRPAARRFFHIDAQSVVVQALAGARRRAARSSPRSVQEAFDKYRIDDPTAVARRQAGGRRRLSRRSARTRAPTRRVATACRRGGLGRREAPDGRSRSRASRARATAPACHARLRSATASVEQALTAGAGRGRGTLASARWYACVQELVDDLHEPLRVVLVREVAGVRGSPRPGSGRKPRRDCGVLDRDDRVVAAPDHAHRHRLGEVGAVDHRDDLARQSTHGATRRAGSPRRARGSLKESMISATSSRSRVRRQPGRGQRPQAGRGEVPQARAGSARPSAWWKPGERDRRIAGVTSGPRPPGATRTIRSVRSGNW